MPSLQARRGEAVARSPGRHTNVERAWENSVLSGLDFLASIGIRAILQNARAHRMRGGGMVLLAPPPLVDEVLRAAGVSNVVPIVADLEAARAALAA